MPSTISGQACGAPPADVASAPASDAQLRCRPINQCQRGRRPERRVISSFGYAAGMAHHAGATHLPLWACGPCPSAHDAMPAPAMKSTCAPVMKKNAAPRRRRRWRRIPLATAQPDADAIDIIIGAARMGRSAPGMASRICTPASSGRSRRRCERYGHAPDIDVDLGSHIAKKMNRRQAWRRRSPAGEACASGHGEDNHINDASIVIERRETAPACAITRRGLVLPHHQDAPWYLFYNAMPGRHLCPYGRAQIIIMI